MSTLDSITVNLKFSTIAKLLSHLARNEMDKKKKNIYQNPLCHKNKENSNILFSNATDRRDLSRHVRWTRNSFRLQSTVTQSRDGASVD